MDGSSESDDLDPNTINATTYFDYKLVAIDVLSYSVSVDADVHAIANLCCSVLSKLIFRSVSSTGCQHSP